MDKKYYQNKKFKFTITKEDFKIIKDIDKFNIDVNIVNKCQSDYNM